MTPQIGVVALRIEARPLAMCCWPQPNKANGTTLLSKASTRIAPHTGSGRLSRSRRQRRNSHKAAAAIARRSQT